MVPLSVESQLLTCGRIKQYFLKNKIPSFQNIAHILKGYGHEFRHFKLRSCFCLHKESFRFRPKMDVTNARNCLIIYVQNELADKKKSA